MLAADAAESEHTMQRKLFVENIRFTSDNIAMPPDSFECNLPLEFDEYACLAQPFLRAFLFNNCETTYDLTIISDEYATNFNTQPTVTYDYIVDLTDKTYPIVTPVTVNVMHATGCVLYIEIPSEILSADLLGTPDLKQFIHEWMLHNLYIAFDVLHYGM